MPPAMEIADNSVNADRTNKLNKRPNKRKLLMTDSVLLIARGKRDLCFRR